MRLAEAAKQLMEAARQDEAFEVIKTCPSPRVGWRARETTTGYLCSWRGPSEPTCLGISVVHSKFSCACPLPLGNIFLMIQLNMSVMRSAQRHTIEAKIVLVVSWSFPCSHCHIDGGTLFLYMIYLIPNLCMRFQPLIHSYNFIYEW